MIDFMFAALLGASKVQLLDCQADGSASVGSRQQACDIGNETGKGRSHPLLHSTSSHSSISER